jgi:hypothetical protein
VKHGAGAVSMGGEGPSEGGARAGKDRAEWGARAGKDQAKGSSTSALCTKFTLIYTYVYISMKKLTIHWFSKRS